MCGPTKAMCQQCKNAFAAKTLEADELKTERDRYKAVVIALCTAYERGELNNSQVSWEDLDLVYAGAVESLSPRDLAEIRETIDAEDAL